MEEQVGNNRGSDSPIACVNSDRHRTQALTPGKPPQRATRSSPLTQMFRTQYRQLIRFCRLRVKNDADAEDIVQEAFLSAKRAYPDKGIEELAPLLFTTVRNLSLNHLTSPKYRRRYDHAEIGEEEGRLACGRSPTPERQLMDIQRLAIAEAAIEELSPRRREALRLHRFEGLSYEEIARRLSVSPTAVKKHVARGVAHIAQRLAEADGEDKNPEG